MKSGFSNIHDCTYDVISINRTSNPSYLLIESIIHQETSRHWVNDLGDINDSSHKHQERYLPSYWTTNFKTPWTQA